MLTENSVPADQKPKIPNHTIKGSLLLHQKQDDCCFSHSIFSLCEHVAELWGGFTGDAGDEEHNVSLYVA